MAVRKKAAPKAADKSPGLQVRLFGDDLWSAVELGERFATGMYVYGTAAKLFQVSVSALCIDVLSQDVSKTPIQLRRRTATGSEQVLPKDHPVADLLEQPSKFQGRRAFFRMLVANLVMDSEYLVAIRRARAGKPIEMQGIRRRMTNIDAELQTRRHVYRFSKGTQNDEMMYGWASEKPLFDDDVAHLITRTLDGFNALSTSSISNGVIGLLRQMQEFQTGIFENGGMPVLAFKFPEGLTPEQFERLKLDLERATKAAREKGKPFILEGAAGKVPEVEKISLSSVDTEFAKANEAAGVEAARYFRVPPHKVYLLASVKYDNEAEQERRYVDEALVPIFDVIEEKLAYVLLDDDERKEYFLWFDREAAYAQDPAERNKIINERWKAGQITFDEMRQGIGQNTVGGDEGRVRMVSGNFVLLDEKNNVIMRAGGNAPEPGKDGEEPKADPKKKDAQIHHLVAVT